MTETEAYEAYVRRHLADLLRIVGKVAAGDYSEKPAFIETDDELSRFIVGFRFMVEDLEMGRAEAERRRLEAQHANEELRFQKTLLERQSEAALEGILVVSPDGRMLSFNRRFVEMWGIPADVVAARSDERAIASVLDRVADPAAFVAKVKDLYASPDERSHDEIRLRDGRTFDRYSAPVRADDGTFYGRVWYFRDVTENRRAQEDLRAMNAQLADVARSRTQLLNTASHELNTPLTPLVLQLHLLRSGALGPLTPRQDRSLDILSRNVQRLSTLVADVLDVARLQSGRLRVRTKPLDVDDLVRQACETFQEPAASAGVRLEVRAGTRARLDGDPDRLTQVMFNLVGNALKFTPTGGRIAVDAVADGDEVVVRIEDSGVGLTDDQAARLFQPFAQVHDPMDRTRAGTGLGLYISKGIVEQHGGRIWCTSAGPGKGTTFAFTLPWAPAKTSSR